MAETLVEMRGIEKFYGRVHALRGVNLSIKRGEIVGLLGDNGAGKSTLIKVLSGAVPYTSGEILIRRKPVRMRSTLDAIANGIETIYQDSALVPQLSIARNLFLGRELPAPGVLGHFGFLDNKTMRARSKAAFDDLGATVRSYTDPVGSMSGGQRQAIAIARACIREGARGRFFNVVDLVNNTNPAIF